MPMVGILLLFAIFSAVYNFSVPTRVAVTHFSVGLLAYRIISEHISLSHKQVGRVLLGWACVANVFIILQIFKIDPIYQPVYEEVAGTTLMPWIMGCVAAMAVPFVASVHPLAPLALAPLAIFSHSTVCFVAYAGAFGAPYIKNFKTVGIILIAGLLYILIFDRVFDHRRFVGLIETSQYIKSLFLGNGLGSFAHSGFLMYNGQTAYHWRWSHNELHQHFFEQGLFAAFTLASWALFLFLDVKDRATKTLLAVIFFLSCFHPIFHFGKTIYLSLIILGMAEASKHKPMGESTWKGSLRLQS